MQEERLILVETRPDIRIRIRSVVIRIRVRNTSIRIRIVTTTIQHTVAGDSAIKLFIIVDCALRYFGSSFVTRYARRFDDCTSEGETRPDKRIRTRSVVNRIRVRNTSKRIHTVTTTTQHTVYSVTEV